MTSRAVRVKANLMLLACAAIWGFAFVAQVAGAHIGAFTFNSTRFTLGGLSLIPLIMLFDRRVKRARDERRMRWADAIVPGMLCGLLLFGASTLQQIGIESTTASNASFITGLYVVMVPLVGIFLGRRATRNIWIGAFLALGGLYLLTMGVSGAHMNPGDALCVASTIFWTGHIIAIGWFAPRLDALRLSVVQFLANGLYAGITALAVEPAAFQGIGTAVVPLLYAGIASVGIAYTLQVIAQQNALESHAAIIMSLETLFGAIGGALLLGETMNPAGYAGAALMLVGIIWSQWPQRTPAQVA